MPDFIVDTSALLAYFDASEPDHATVEEALGTTADRLVVSHYVVAELDYLVTTRHGLGAELPVLDEVSGEGGAGRHRRRRPQTTRSVIAKCRPRHPCVFGNWRAGNCFPSGGLGPTLFALVSSRPFREDSSGRPWSPKYR